MRSWRYTLSLALTFALSASGAVATSFHLTHPYGELVTSGEIIARLYPSRGQLGCKADATVQRVGRTVTLTAYLLPAATPFIQCPDGPASATVGELSEVGWWTVIVRVYEADRATFVDQTSEEVLVTKQDFACNKFPQKKTYLNVIHKVLQPFQLVNRLENDPTYVRKLGSPDSWYPVETRGFLYLILGYPTQLVNPYDQLAGLETTGEFSSMWLDVGMCFSPGPPDALGKTVEFYHSGLDHYFYSADAQEIDGLDTGSGAKGWARTGKTFTVVRDAGCHSTAPQQTAYRFYGGIKGGPETHFFTVDRQECRALADSGVWQFEGAPFWGTPTDARGGCSLPDETPLYRIWRSFGTSNHRFTTERSVVAEMAAKGWMDEGVSMCVKR